MKLNTGNEMPPQLGGKRPKFNIYWVWAAVAVVILSWGLLGSGEVTHPTDWDSVKTMIEQGDVQNPGTGRHFALAETARIMAARGLLQSDRMAVMDLALYPDPGTEKLFLQDLYAALHAPGEIVVFEHYESCHPGFLRILSDLAVKGSAPLSSRYLVNKEGILVEAGTALAPGAVSRIDPCGKYLIFFSRKGREALADKFGASFVAAVGDVCQTAPFTPEALAALAAQQLNALAQRVHSRLGLTLTAGADVRDYVAAQCSKEKGAEGLADCCERIFRALSEYCLQTDTKLSGTVALTAAPDARYRGGFLPSPSTAVSLRRMRQPACSMPRRSGSQRSGGMPGAFCAYITVYEKPAAGFRRYRRTRKCLSESHRRGTYTAPPGCSGGRRSRR